MLNKNTHITNLISSLSEDIAAESNSANGGYNSANISAIESELSQIWNSADAYKTDVTFDPKSGFKSFQDRIANLEPTAKVTTETKVVKFRSNRVQYLTGIAASAALLIGAWFLYPSDTITYYNDGNSPQEFVLVDGSNLFLFPGAKLEVDNSFSADNRNINLNDGQVVVDVESSKVPFVMSMGDGDIVVTGTKFAAEHSDDDIVINLYEGSINYEYDGKVIKCIPGSKIVHNIANGSVAKSTEVDQGLLDFANGTLSFIDTPLLEVVTRLEQFYNVTFTGKENLPSDLNFTSAVLDNQSLDNILKTLEVSFDLEINKVDEINYTIQH